MGERLWNFFAGVVVGVVLCATGVFVAVEKRDELADELERTTLRLDEARRDCRRPPTRLSCSPVGSSSGLFMCQLPGDRFTWFTWKGSAEL